MIKFLVLGCNGMAGHLISLYLKECGYNVMGLARKKSKYINSIVADVKDIDGLKKIVETGKYNIIINCIGILNEAAETHKANAVFLNAFLPHYLAEITNKLDTQVIHMSTDCVFSGLRGQYTETDQCDGTSFYAKTKALGELNDNKNITLRESIIGPDINVDGIGLLNWFMKQKSPIYGYTKCIWTGLTTLELAKIIENISKNKIIGLFNMVPSNTISKYDLLRLINKYFRHDVIKIYPNNSIISDKSLKRSNFSSSISVPDYDEMIFELSEWVKNHESLYEQYFKK